MSRLKRRHLGKIWIRLCFARPPPLHCVTEMVSPSCFLNKSFKLAFVLKIQISASKPKRAIQQQGCSTGVCWHSLYSGGNASCVARCTPHIPPPTTPTLIGFGLVWPPDLHTSSGRRASRRMSPPNVGTNNRQATGMLCHTSHEVCQRTFVAHKHRLT